MNLKHYIAYAGGKLSSLMDHDMHPDWYAMEEWKTKIETSEITISELTNHPVGFYGDYLTSRSSNRFCYNDFTSPFLITRDLGSAIDAMPGEFIYLITSSDDSIQSLLKINERCELPSPNGVDMYGRQWREFLSSDEVIGFLHRNFPGLCTWFDGASVAKPLAWDNFTIDYHRTNMLGKNLRKLTVSWSESQDEIEVPCYYILEATSYWDPDSEESVWRDIPLYCLDLKGTPIREWLNHESDAKKNVICEIKSSFKCELSISQLPNNETEIEV